MPLAPYACRPETSRGRLHREPETGLRTPFQRDRDRVIHSTAFRRLQYKTQVFVYHEGDHYRTRLTHSLEVAQIARALCRRLEIDDDLGEAVALAHDLGHTPFGHSGERAMAEVMAPYGGFDHNAQTLRILTRLERRYADFDGLNLTWETLEGVVKHNGPLLGQERVREQLSPAIAEYDKVQDLHLDSHAGLEAQAAAVADDIAYDNHDIDDGLRADLFTLEEISQVPLVGKFLTEVRRRHGELERPRLIHETVRRLIHAMVEDVVSESQARLARLAPDSADSIRRAGRATIAFSAGMAEAEKALKSFLYERMYRHGRVAEMREAAEQVLRELFALFMADPRHLPSEWRALTDGRDESSRARIVADYVAGMTDRYAFEEHRRLTRSA